MKTKELALTNLTGSEHKIAALLELPKITPGDLDNFDVSERQYLAAVLTKMLRGLKDTERDDFLDKIEQIMPAGNQREIWEYNHQVITDAISNLISQYGKMPGKNQLAQETGLSRQTITKHLRNYETHPAYVEQMEQLKFMAPRLIAKVYKFAARGDVRAARLYLETVGATNKQEGKTVVNRQNNYIQINNTILSQENLKRLSADQLNQIESVVAMVLPVGEVAG